ncbi:MAG TPA: DMT family transporter [Usitatibacter sp.]|nr:DMT family transporter [Usitatibacter sp.]
MDAGQRRAVLAALGAALLFGASTPAAKVLLGDTSPLLLAGLLYLGSGTGLAIYRVLARVPRISMSRPDTLWLAGAILAGGIAGPALLMAGLARMPASEASLLLNGEGVFTALIAWFVFRENVDFRVAIGMLLIVAGGAALSWPQAGGRGDALGAVLVVAACLAWGIDNNLTRKVSLNDASRIAMLKGLVAGTTNVVLALAAGARLPGLAVGASALAVGFLGYGVSLALFVVALRGLGTARTGAYFSTAPFAGALLSVAFLGDGVGVPLALAAALMAVGVWLHLSEHHDHLHSHAPVEHEHEHEHDEHHLHAHPPGQAPGPERHSHAHRHERLAHRHGHFPDAHHRHDH